ncbi:hypothetical protein ACFP2T_16605 [Plantactinospora solaniradicis]|uniref:Uncharacterized protein n=1 Tax=Plantactinospora solaniradicis TaxID=1723736 RepID=A0ABW1KAI3_9ACTN
MRTKTLGELIRDYGRAMNIAGTYAGLGSRYAARSEQVKANALYAEIEKRLTNDDVDRAAV